MRRELTRRIRSIVFFAVIATVIATLPACKKSNQPAAPQKTKIGVIVPLTGPMAYLGKGEQIGMELGLRDLGPQGQHVQLVIEDSQGKPDVALTAFRKMMDIQGVRVFVSSTTPSVMALLPAIQDSSYDTLFIAQCLAPGITKKYPFSFRIYTASDQEIDLLASYAKAKGHLRLGMLYIRNSFGEEGAKLFRARAQALGCQIVCDESIDFQERDFRVLLTRTKQASPDALFVYCYSTNYPPLFQQMDEAGLKMPILGSLNLALDKMETKVAPEILARAVFPAARYYYDPSEGKVQRFNEQVMAAGTEPTSDIAFFYDTAQMLAQAIAASPERAPKEIGQRLRALVPYDGVTGTIQFDTDRDSRVDMKLVRWQDRKLILIDGQEDRPQ